MFIPFENVGAVGLVTDLDGFKLGQGAWTAVKNVRFRDGKVERFLGHSQYSGTPTIAPYWLLQVVPSTTPWWIYAGLNKVYVYDGTAHTNITRQTAGVDVNYSATASKNWTGCVLNGIPVLNNGVDPPQKWAPVSTGQRLLPLDYVTGTSTWASLSYSCGAMRSYLGYLIALDVTKSGTRYKRLVKWSHPAATGAVPASWDEADPAVDAGEYEIAETEGACLDLKPLKDINVVYKEDSVWGMQYTGGTKIFRFWRLFGEFGMLSRRCAQEYKRQHFVFGNGDVLVHDGQSYESLITKRLLRNIFNRLAPDTFQTSFVARSPRTKEIWFCFPEAGQALPNLALVYNLVDGTYGLRDLPSAAHIEAGVADLGTDIWDGDTGTWESDSTVWGDAGGAGGIPRVIVAAPNDTKLYVADQTTQFAGTDFTAYVERMGLPITFHQKEPPDFTSRKVISEVIPQLTGTYGGTVNVYLGAQEKVDGPIAWSAALPFRIGIDEKVDHIVNTRIASIRFESTTNIDWQLQGFTLNAFRAGHY